MAIREDGYRPVNKLDTSNPPGDMFTTKTQEQINVFLLHEIKYAR